MKFKLLIDKEGNEFNLNPNNLFCNRQSYKRLLQCFKGVYYQNRFNFISNIDIYVSRGQLIIKQNELINVIVLIEDNTLIIDKSFERDYPILYKKFKPVIEDYSNQKFDITYTDFCGRTMFLEYEKPKFSSIEERDGFINVLLEEMYQ